jgi:thiol-disulfide isomerase/thioredoxin
MSANSIQSPPGTNTTNNTNVEKKEYVLFYSPNCKFCKKLLSRKDNLNRHEKICKEKNKIEDIIELKNKVDQLEKKINISNKTINNNGTINNNNGNINNGITNNIHINALGFENIIPKLNEKEKIDLLTGLLFKEIPHVELVRKIFTNEKFMEDRNTMITNLQTKTCMAFNKDTNKFEAKNKNEYIDNLIDYRHKDIKDLYKEMQDSKKIKSNARKLIEDYIEQFDDLRNTESYKKNKEEIIYIIYNCKEIMKKLKDEYYN